MCRPQHLCCKICIKMVFDTHFKLKTNFIFEDIKIAEGLLPYKLNFQGIAQHQLLLLKQKKERSLSI